MNVSKGSKVRAHWFNSKPLGTFSLAGVQPKVTGNFVEVTGVCRHFRGNDPSNPTEIRIFLDIEGTPPEGIELVKAHGCDCEPGHVEIDPNWIVEVLSP